MSVTGIFLADGFEEIEGLTVVDILRRAKVEVKTVSIGETKRVTGSHGISVEADELLSQCEVEKMDMLVLPGGMPGTKNLRACQKLAGFLTQAHREGKGIAAICAAPSVLGGLGILEGRKAVCYPGFEDQLEGADVLYDPVVTDGHITTSRGMGTAIPFALELVSRLAGREKAVQVAESILFK